MTFEEYQQRPVYRAQCATFAICREFLGAPNGDLATGADHPILYFRVLPPYRNAYSLALRKKIADLVRAERQRNRHPGFASAGNFVRATEAARAAITRATGADAMSASNPAHRATPRPYPWPFPVTLPAPGHAPHPRPAREPARPPINAPLAPF